MYCYPERPTGENGEECVSKDLRCNGKINCEDGSDERNCHTFIRICQNDEFSCKNGNLKNITKTLKNSGKSSENKLQRSMRKTNLDV